MSKNIVQAEFFHVDVIGAKSLDEVMKDCADRARESHELAQSGQEWRSGVKTVVRFYDDTKELTRLAHSIVALKKEFEKAIEQAEPYSWFAVLWALYFGSKRSRLARKLADTQEKARRITATRLYEALASGRPVALERVDHSFRPVRFDETHELTVSAARSKAVWLFIFTSNDLYADENTIVVSAM